MKKIKIFIIPFAVLSVLGLSAIFLFAKPAICSENCPKQISNTKAKDFNELIKNKNSVLIDLRTPEEYKSGYISGASNINFNDKNEFEKFLSSADKNKNYLIYCRTGNRSGQALKIMEDRGFNNIVNLTGGIVGWETGNYPVVK